MSVDFTAPVAVALDSLRACFPDARLDIEPDGSGGARVAVQPIPLSPVYMQETTWVGGHIVPQFPYADIYPLFVRGDIARRDSRPLGEGLSPGHMFLNRSAVQVSRRSPHRDPNLELASHKFLKVLQWLNLHPGA